MRVLLAGLWARRGLNAACLLVTVIAVAACVLGPMYARASSEHLLDTRIDQRATYSTGLTTQVPALKDSDVPHGDPGRYQPPRPSSLLDTAKSVFNGEDRRFWGPQRSWLLDRGGSFKFGGEQFVVPLYYRQGMCRLAQVHGHCPSGPDQVLLQQTMADTMHAGVGDTITLDYQDRYIVNAKGTSFGAEAERHEARTFHVVGTYRITDPGLPAWFDLSRTDGVSRLRPPPPSGMGASGPPLTPAMLVAPSSMTSQSFVAGVDRPIDEHQVNLDTMDEAQHEATRFQGRVIELTASDNISDLDLDSLFREVRGEHRLLSRVMIAALAPLVLLALLLLFSLVSAVAQVRRPYVALAKLRGHSRAQVLGFALSEPFLVVALAVPVAVAGAVAGGHLIARTWLHPGIPVGFDTSTLVSLAVVVGAALAASAAAAVAVIREPLSAALASSVQRRPTSRLAVVLRSAVVAVAVASVVQLLTSGHQSAQLLALLAPSFIALAVAVGGVVVLRMITRLWTRATATRGGTAAFLASRRLARRQDLVSLMTPLLLAVSVITFAVSASATSDDWRLSRARADVGAASTYITDVSPGRLLAVTRQVDPHGKYVAAAVYDNSGDGMTRRVLLDTSRLATVASWDASWSDVPVRTLQKRLHPAPLHRLPFTGRRVSVHLTDTHLTARSHDRLELRLQYVDDRGEQTDVLVGRIRNGASQTPSTTVENCSHACLVEQLYVSGDSDSVTDAQGRLTVGDVAVDGHTVDWRLRNQGAWRPARPFPVSFVDPPVLATGRSDGLHLRLFLGHLPVGPDGSPPAMVSGYARVTPSSTPDVEPVLVTDSTRTEQAARPGSGIAIDYPHSVVSGVALNGQAVPMRVVGRVHALPELGRVGSLADLETSLVEYEPPPGVLVTTQLWVAPHAPASVLAKIRAQGVGLSAPHRLAGVLHGLKADAFSLGFRVFLVVDLATLLLAILGVFVSAVLQARWRSYEVASLRVVGVSQRSLLLGSMLEYVVMLGLAVLFGLVSAYLSLLLVLPSMSLGTADPDAPAPIYAVHWAEVAGVGLALFVLAAVIALVVSRRITRLGRPSTLRWAEQG